MRTEPIPDWSEFQTYIGNEAHPKGLALDPATLRQAIGIPTPAERLAQIAARLAELNQEAGQLRGERERLRGVQP